MGHDMRECHGYQVHEPPTVKVFFLRLPRSCEGRTNMFAQVFFFFRFAFSHSDSREITSPLAKEM